MPSIRKIVKYNSKRALTNKWGKACMAFLLYVFANAFFLLIDFIISAALDLPIFTNTIMNPNNFINNVLNTSIPVIISTSAVTFASFLVLVPLKYGVFNWYYRLVGNETVDMMWCFHFFDNAKLMVKSWFMSVNIFIRTLLWGILFISPAVTILYINYIVFPEKITAEEITANIILNICGYALLFLGLIFTAIIRNKYYFAKFLMMSDNKMKISKAIRLSTKIAKGQKVKIFVLKLSFIPWFILSLLIIPVLFTAPYYFSSMALYAKASIEKYSYDNVIKNEDIPENKSEEKISTDEINIPIDETIKSPKENYN